MEQHPIPQNITNFEFKLIGDMTVKQFAYLAGCTVFAYLVFIMPIHPFIKFPIAIFSAILGVALAFLPVEGRPLDRWIASFIRALFTPNQYIFHKDTQATDFFKTYTSTVKPQVATLKTPTVIESDERFTTFLKQTRAPLADIENSDRESLARIQKLEDETQLLPTPIQSEPIPVTQAVVQPAQISQPTPTPLPAEPKEPSDMEKKLEEALAEREQLLKELEALKQSVAKQPPVQSSPIPSQPVSTPPVPPFTPLFTVPPKQPKSPSPPLSPFPQAPNIVAGVVKDCKDDILPNIIVEVKDTSGSPLRAFKTNKLGQFFASTPLSNGQYAIELEDPKNTYFFDPLSINLTGASFVPLEIKARDPAVNERLKLHAALFGGKNGQPTN